MTFPNQPFRAGVDLTALLAVAALGLASLAAAEIFLLHL